MVPVQAHAGAVQVSMKGPSPYAVCVLRALLKRPMHVPELVCHTNLPERTIRSQLEALRKAESVRVKARLGAWAIYEPVLVVL